tara:strand:- start:460 stop:729 length:270 start_codon:yes stop_codon:yes gene_type:complete
VEKKDRRKQSSSATFIPQNYKKINQNEPLKNGIEHAYSNGMKVKHNRFGLGVIFKLEGKGANKKISVNFTDVGEKTLLVKFAKLIILKE